MAKLTWDEPEKRLYEKGIDRGVLYLPGLTGVPWSGLTGVDITPVGGDIRSFFIDGKKYLMVSGPEEFAASIKAYTYPDEFMLCDGTVKVHSGLYATQQPRRTFGLSYRTMIGNATNPDFGYKIHIVYNAMVSPTQLNYQTIGDSNEAVDFSWDITALPPPMAGIRPTAHVIIDTRSSNPNAISDVEAILYGTEELEADLPTLAELIAIFDAYAILSVTDNGDGTFTVEGPDEAITMIDADTFEITWPSAVPIDADTWSISSL